MARHNKAFSKIAVYEPGVSIDGSMPTAWMPGYAKKIAENPPSIGVPATPQSTLDGQRFLIEVPLDQPAARTSISVVLNWPALVKQ